MSRKKRIPLQLKGSDEQYFRTREILSPAEEAPTEEPDPPAAHPEPSQGTSENRQGRGARAEQLSSAPEPTPDNSPETGEVVSRIVPLGRPLSRRLQTLAEEVGVSVDDLLYAARKKAVKRFRARIAGPDKPDIPEVVKGGETIRISFKLTGEELTRLTTWFDPLDLGLATKMVAPLLAEALRAEIEAICSSAS